MKWLDYVSSREVLKDLPDDEKQTIAKELAALEARADPDGYIPLASEPIVRESQLTEDLIGRLAAPNWVALGLNLWQNAPNPKRKAAPIVPEDQRDALRSVLRKLLRGGLDVSAVINTVDRARFFYLGSMPMSVKRAFAEQRQRVRVRLEAALKAALALVVRADEWLEGTDDQDALLAEGEAYLNALNALNRSRLLTPRMPKPDRVGREKRLLADVKRRLKVLRVSENDTRDLLDYAGLLDLTRTRRPDPRIRKKRVSSPRQKN
jgi:hypothetical protein